MPALILSTNPDGSASIAALPEAPQELMADAQSFGSVAEALQAAGEVLGGGEGGEGGQPGGEEGGEGEDGGIAPGSGPEGAGGGMIGGLLASKDEEADMEAGYSGADGVKRRPMDMGR